MTEGLACLDVGKVHLDKRTPDTGQCVTECDAGVRVGARVDQEPAHSGSRLLDPVHQQPFHIALKRLDLDSQRRGFLTEPGVDVPKRQRPIDLRLALSQQIQVRAVKYCDPHFFRLWSHDLNISISSSSSPSSSPGSAAGSDACAGAFVSPAGPNHSSKASSELVALPGAGGGADAPGSGESGARGPSR